MRTNNQKTTMFPSKGRAEDQFETFKTYFSGPQPKTIDGHLVYRARSSSDAKAKVSEAWTWITSLGLSLMAACGPDNTIIIKQFKISFNSQF